MTTISAEERLRLAFKTALEEAENKSNDKISKENLVEKNCFKCKKIIFIPKEESKKYKKFACYDCYLELESNLSESDLKDISFGLSHEDHPRLTAEFVTNELLEQYFSSFWSENKEEFKDMSKKELAKEMFANGSYNALKFFLSYLNDFEEDKEK